MTQTETDLAVQTLGVGPQPVLALHCTLAHSGAWKGLARALEPDVTLVAPDMYSHGNSPDWHSEGDFLDHMRRATLPLLTQPMHLVGHSFGAVLALALACAAPDKVRSLTLAEPVFFAAGALDRPDVIAEGHATETAIYDAFRAEDWENGARLFNRAWSGAGPKWADMPERLRAAMIRAVRVVPPSGPGLSQDSLGILPELGRLNMPTLILRGGQSPRAIEAITGAIAARLPNAREVVFDTAGHMLPLTHSKEMAAHVAGLITTA